jgi:hypothetical protein
MFFLSQLNNLFKFNERRKQREVQRTIAKLSQLGFTVRITPVA